MNNFIELVGIIILLIIILSSILISFGILCFKKYMDYIEEQEEWLKKK